MPAPHSTVKRASESVYFVQSKLKHFDFHRLQFDRLVFPRQFMRGTAMYFFSRKCGRHLQEPARETRGEPLELGAVELWRGIGANSRAIGVVGIGGKAKAESRIVALLRRPA